MKQISVLQLNLLQYNRLQTTVAVYYWFSRLSTHVRVRDWSKSLWQDPFT